MQSLITLHSVLCVKQYIPSETAPFCLNNSSVCGGGGGSYHSRFVTCSVLLLIAVLCVFTEFDITDLFLYFLCVEVTLLKNHHSVQDV